MDLQREHIYAGFSVLLDAGFRAPFEPQQMDKVVNTWWHMLRGEMTKEIWETSIGAYVRSPDGNTFGLRSRRSPSSCARTGQQWLLPLSGIRSEK